MANYPGSLIVEKSKVGQRGGVDVIHDRLGGSVIPKPGDTSCGARLRLGFEGGVKAAQVSGFTRREPA